jgi:hypothetical protein
LHGEIETPPFSAEGRIEAGVALRRLQRGEAIEMPHSRPMQSVGKACHELRITGREPNVADRLLCRSVGGRDPRGVRQYDAADTEGCARDVQGAVAALPVGVT